MDSNVTITKREPSILEIRLNRPSVRNAFDFHMAKLITNAFRQASDDKDVRIVVLCGEGEVFCAGGDIAWMREVAASDESARLRAAEIIADLFSSVAACVKPTLAVVQGAAIGGGIGLISACDIVVAAPNAIFSVSEARLGIIPACVMPFLIQRISIGQARRLMLTASNMSAQAAQNIGLVHEVAESPQLLDKFVDSVIAQLFVPSPRAQQEAKKLLAEITKLGEGDIEKSLRHSVKVLSNSWSSKDGQEGMLAFVEKRKPRWQIDS